MFLVLTWTLVEGTEDVDNDVAGNKKLVEKVNAADSTWKAALTSRFLTYKEEELGYLAGTIPHHNLDDEIPVGGSSSPPDDGDVDLPKDFDARKRWPKCKSIGMIRDQGPCGGCWAISVAQVATDRYCIQTGQKDNPILSYRQMLTCSGSGSCHGGRENGSWDYLIENGLVTGGRHTDTDSCQPSPFKLCDHHQKGNYDLCPPAHDTPECQHECTGEGGADRYNSDRYFAKKYWDIYGEKALKKELFLRGPVSIAMRVNKDFYFYSEGVYQHLTGPFIGFHAVRLIGWGEDTIAGKTIPYWIITNTWNSDWGEDGVIRIKRGNHYMGIKSGLAGEMKIPEVAVSASLFRSSAQTWNICMCMLLLMYFLL